MESAIGTFLGVCAHGGGFGWECGMWNAEVWIKKLYANLVCFLTGCTGIEIHRTQLSFSNALLWGCEHYSQRIDHAEVGTDGCI